ncbi:MAG: signal peptidase I [Flavobacterium sp.]|nr:signal peptidase I [Flavobacterium sp.]
MTLMQWLIFFLIVQIIHFAGTWRLYEGAGRKRWEAAVPIYNAIVLMKIINRPTWWTILLFVPIVNLVMFPVVWVETLRSFGKNTTVDTILGIATLGLYIVYVNYTEPLNYISDRSLQPNTKAGDTISSLLFAIVVATLVHGYVMQPFNIPTGSLEKTLLIGDFLFVSKFNYGARTPMTPIAAPMVHDTLPIVNTKSYLSWPQLPYFRLPGTEAPEKNDIVVFNWPVDTVYKFFDRSGRRAYKPVDKKSNYVKRCVGTPGDSLSVIDGYVHINGKKLILSDRARPQYAHIVITNGTPLDPAYLLFELGITDGFRQVNATAYEFQAITEEAAERLRNNPVVTSVERYVMDTPDPRTFPYSKNWNIDNMGPIYIPKKDVTVDLNVETLPFYKRIIQEYEQNELIVNGNEIRINGQPTTKYTFKQNYYWMMGDNRHNSEDSRNWGYVPENHIVGKPVFIWLSLDPHKRGLDKIRWERMFTTVGGDGEPVSYFKFFLILLGAYFAIDFFIKRKKKAQQNS